MKQRDEELKLREQEVFKALREVEEELAIEVDIEEKKLDEEEQRLQRMKEEFSRMKANLAEELEKSREHRKKEIQKNNEKLQEAKDELKQRNEEVAIAMRNHDDLLEKQRNREKIYEIELTTKETEVNNMGSRLKNEKKEFEVEHKERLLREIQVK